MNDDIQFRSAIERQFEIAGEALRRLELIDESLVERITDYRDIIGFRNRIAHGYDAIDYSLLWKIATEKLELLHQQAKSLLAEFE